MQQSNINSLENNLKTSIFFLIFTFLGLFNTISDILYFLSSDKFPTYEKDTLTLKSNTILENYLLIFLFLPILVKIFTFYLILAKIQAQNKGIKPTNNNKLKYYIVNICLSQYNQLLPAIILSLISYLNLLGISIFFYQKFKYKCYISPNILSSIKNLQKKANQTQNSNIIEEELTIESPKKQAKNYQIKPSPITETDLESHMLMHSNNQLVTERPTTDRFHFDLTNNNNMSSDVYMELITEPRLFQLIQNSVIQYIILIGQFIQVFLKIFPQLILQSLNNLILQTQSNIFESLQSIIQIILIVYFLKSITNQLDLQKLKGLISLFQDEKIFMDYSLTQQKQVPDLQIQNVQLFQKTRKNLQDQKHLQKIHLYVNENNLDELKSLSFITNKLYPQNLQLFQLELKHKGQQLDQPQRKILEDIKYGIKGQKIKYIDNLNQNIFWGHLQESPDKINYNEIQDYIDQHSYGQDPFQLEFYSEQTKKFAEIMVHNSPSDHISVGLNLKNKPEFSEIFVKNVSQYIKKPDITVIIEILSNQSNIIINSHFKIQLIYENFNDYHQQILQLLAFLNLDILQIKIKDKKIKKIKAEAIEITEIQEKETKKPKKEETKKEDSQQIKIFAYQSINFIDKLSYFPEIQNLDIIVPKKMEDSILFIDFQPLENLQSVQFRPENSEKIEKLCLNFQKNIQIQEKKLDNLFKSLQYFQNLQTLELNFSENSTNLTCIVLKDLSNSIPKLSQQLSNLTLNFDQNEKFEDEGFTAFSKSLSHLKNLQNLSLNFQKNSQFSNSSFTHLGNSLKNLYELQNLNLNFETNSKFSDFESVFPKNFNKLVNLETIDLNFENNNEISKICSQKHNFDHLYKLKHLKLNLRNNTKLEPQNIENLGKTLKNLFILQEIDIDFQENVNFQDENFQVFCENISQIPSLMIMKLNLSNSTKLSDNSLEYFKNCLQNMRNLEIFDLNFSENEIFTNPGLINLGEGLKNLYNIKKIQINFSKNTNFTNETFVKFFEKLEKIDFLESLSLNFSHNQNFNNTGLILLANSLEQLIKLENLELILQQNNNINNNGLEEFTLNLQDVQPLKSAVLDFSFNTILKQETIQNIIKENKFIKFDIKIFNNNNEQVEN